MRRPRKHRKGGLSRILGGALALGLFVVAPPVSGEPIVPSKGRVRGAYEKLKAAHCDLGKVEVGTPLEARILRNTPYAIAGRFFKSAALRALYGNDGAWYRPKRAGVMPRLSKADARCVAKLKRLERRLRKKLPIAKAVERVITRHPRVFLSLRKGSGVARYGGAQSHASARTWTWRFTDYGACGGDGSTAQKGDCAGFSVTCELPQGVQDFRKLDCTVTWSG